MRYSPCLCVSVVKFRVWFWGSIFGVDGLETDGRAKHVELTDEGVEVVRRAGKDLATTIESLFPRDELPVESLAESQRLITEVLTRAVSPGPT